MSGRNYNYPYPHYSPKPKGTKWVPKKRSFRHIQEKEKVSEPTNLWQLHSKYPYYIINLDDYQAMVVKLAKTRDSSSKVTINSIYGNFGGVGLGTYIPGFLSDISENVKTFKYIEVAEVHQREKLIKHYVTKISKLHKKQTVQITMYNNIIKTLEAEIEEYYDKHMEKFV